MIISDPKDLHFVEKMLTTKNTVAFDIETTGLNPRKDVVVGFGFSDGSEGYYIVHKYYDGEKLVEAISKQDCLSILKLLNAIKWIGWNSTFEIKFCLHYFGINLTNSMWSDGMLIKHTCDEERPFGLKEVAEMLYGTSVKNEQNEMIASVKSNGGSEKEYYKASFDLLGKYCIQDCQLTFKINDHYLSILKQQGLFDFYFKDEVMPLYKDVVIEMENEGVFLDMPLLDSAINKITNDINDLEDKIQSSIAPLLEEFDIWWLNKELPPKRSGEFAQYLCKYANLILPETKGGKYSLTEKNLKELLPNKYADYLLGNGYLDNQEIYSVQKLWFNEQGLKYKFNLLSKDHLKKLFFDRLQEEPLNTTDKGNPQVDDLFLDQMADKYEWCELLRQYNKLNKLKGTYLDRFKDQNENGTYYPQWMMHRTVTGRLSGDFQQLPKKKEGSGLVESHNNIIRNLIISKPGYKLIGADYSSLEVVVFADDAGDAPLLNMIKNNEDFYSRIAIDVFNLQNQYSADKKADNFLKIHKPKLRQDSKVWGLGIRYNMQAFKLSKTLDIDQEKAQEIIDKYFKAYPKLKARMEQLAEFAKTNGYIKSKGGRIKRVPMLKKLAYTYKDELLDSLKLWKKYKDSPVKYKQMQYLSKQFKSDINAVMNFPIQSMASTIMAKAAIAISREIKRLNLDAKIIMIIHDELVIHCKEEHVEKVHKLMKYLMENTTKLNAPLQAEPQIGVRYGEIK